MASLTNVVDSIRGVDVKAIYITGHTDSIGSIKKNQVLSVERTENVKNFLVKRGAKEELISTKNFGLSKPIAPNSSEKGRQINRRVDILVEYYSNTKEPEPIKED
jgi:OOP family OmpA-OmpF porin